MTQSTVQLAIETTSGAGEICLGAGGEILAVRTLPQVRRHNVELVPTLDELFNELQLPRASLTHAYISLGPGSFTGLRIGVATAKILAATLGVKIAGVPTLDALTPNVSAAFTHAVVCLNAKRGTTYAAVFQRTGETFTDCREITPRGVYEIEALLASAPPGAAVLGEVIGQKYSEAASRCGLTLLPEAQARVRSEVVYHLGQAAAAAGRLTEAAALAPIYGREPEAVRLWQKR